MNIKKIHSSLPLSMVFYAVTMALLELIFGLTGLGTLTLTGVLVQALIGAGIGGIAFERKPASRKNT